MQRTRCAYFRDEDGLPCNKRRPGSGCSALHGLNRNHAIFGWSDACVATNPSDVAVAFAALDAKVVVRGPNGRAIDSVRGVPSPARRHAGARQRARPRRPDRRDRSAGTAPRAAPRITSRSATGNPTSSRLSPRRPRSRWTAGASVRRGSPWAASRTSPGASAAAEAALRGVSLDDIDALRSAIARSFADARPLAHNGIQGRACASAPPCARCKSREHAHERHRTTDFARRRAAEGDRRRAVHGRYSASRAPRTPPSSTARSPTAGRCRSIPAPPRRAPGVHCGLHASQHAAHEPDAQALEPPSSARPGLSAAAGRPRSTMPASRSPWSSRTTLRPGGACRDADRGRVRGRASRSYSAATTASEARRSSAIPVAGQLVGRRRPEGASRPRPSRSSRPTRPPIAITIRWSRMRRRRSGRPTAR